MMSDVGSSIEVLLIVEADIATTQLTEQLLSECSCLGIRYKKVYLTELDQHVFSESALPLFVRTADPVAISWMQSLKRSNIPYFYYIDDNFWLIDGDTALAKYYQHPIIRRSLKFAVEKANVVITNSVALREFILPKNRNTVLLPAFLTSRCCQQATSKLSLSTVSVSRVVPRVRLIWKCSRTSFPIFSHKETMWSLSSSAVCPNGWSRAPGYVFLGI